MILDVYWLAKFEQADRIDVPDSLVKVSENGITLDDDLVDEIRETIEADPDLISNCSAGRRFEIDVYEARANHHNDKE